jgi:hypothetical protein
MECGGVPARRDRFGFWRQSGIMPVQIAASVQIAEPFATRLRLIQSGVVVPAGLATALHMIATLPRWALESGGLPAAAGESQVAACVFGRDFGGVIRY